MGGPQYPPPPSEPPPSGGPPPPGAWQPPPGAWGPAVPNPWGPPPPGAWQPPPSYGISPTRTEPFAIVSLVASLAGLFFCGVGQIVGIVFGHIARSRIKRSGDDGAGLALAGLIIGYVEIALVVAAIAILLAVGVHTGDHSSDSEALRLADNIAYSADSHASTPHDADVVRLAIREAGLADNTVYVGSTDVEAVTATDADLAAEDWRLEVHGGIFGDACLWLPAASSGTPRIVAGDCHRL